MKCLTVCREYDIKRHKKCNYDERPEQRRRIIGVEDKNILLTILVGGKKIDVPTLDAHRRKEIEHFFRGYEKIFTCGNIRKKISHWRLQLEKRECVTRKRSFKEAISDEEEDSDVQEPSVEPLLEDERRAHGLLNILSMIACCDNQQLLDFRKMTSAAQNLHQASNPPSGECF